MISPESAREAVMHTLHLRNFFALVCLMLLTASVAAATPENHSALMADGAYRKAFGVYAAAEQEAMKRLDARDFAAVQKAVHEEMAESARLEISAGSSEAEAWSNAYAQGSDSLNRELTWDWLRRHPEGVQGMYRMQSKAFDGWMTVRKEKKADMYTVHISAIQKKAPFNSGELNGSGRLKGSIMQVANQSDDRNPIRIAFHGEKASITEPEAFKKSGLLGADVSFDGDFIREKKVSGKNFSEADRKAMGVFLSNFTEIGMTNFTAGDVLNTEKPYEMIRFGIWHNFINNYSRIQPCTTHECPWGSLTIDCASVRDSLQRYFGYTLRQCLSASHPDSGSPYDSYHFDGTKYHFEGASGEAVYHARVKEASQGADGLIEMKGVLYNADDEKDILGSFTALARPHTWKGKNTLAIVSLKTQFRE